MFETTEQHPFIELLLRDPKISYLLPIGFVAIVAAPLMEETFFRLILQGWLERVIGRVGTAGVGTARRQAGGQLAPRQPSTARITRRDT